MKILGKTSGGFILEAGNDELANLLGFYSAYQSKSKIDSLSIGTKIEVAAMFQQLYQLSAARKEADKCQKELLAIAAKLTRVIPIIPVVQIPEQS